MLRRNEKWLIDRLEIPIDKVTTVRLVNDKANDGGYYIHINWEDEGELLWEGTYTLKRTAEEMQKDIVDYIRETRRYHMVKRAYFIN